MTPLAYTVIGLCMVLTVLNLLLTLGVIRKLSRSNDAPTVPVPAMAVGSPVPAQAVGPHGLPSADISALVAFLATDCAGCHAQADDLATFVAGHDGLDRVVAVVSQMHPGSSPGPVPPPDDSRVVTVTEDLDGPWQVAFQVTDFPTFFVVQQGRVSGAGHHISRLLAAVG